MRSVNQMDAFTKPLSEVHKNLQLAKREYKAAKKDGAKLRLEFQERLLRAQKPNTLPKVAHEDPFYIRGSLPFVQLVRKVV